MFYLGEGNLRISRQYRFATDGVVFFKILSPALLFRLKFNRKKDLGIQGRFLAINDKIIWVQKRKPPILKI